jgi:hypothetical protein
MLVQIFKENENNEEDDDNYGWSIIYFYDDNGYIPKNNFKSNLYYYPLISD